MRNCGASDLCEIETKAEYFEKEPKRFSSSSSFLIVADGRFRGAVVFPLLFFCAPQTKFFMQSPMMNVAHDFLVAALMVVNNP